ncbi:Hypothetical predicted protein [Mytilus galloprovincialis]|uniref:Uncharacterized protein n=1 Tax=Mytilus galloprovincialis TaxID=29158 RepID=A0A8B6DGT8_MYTGA|nr:Hypothetical predicted protein [Mytilus galloprovincialis]
MSQQCSFKNNSPCGSSQYYASSEEVIHILKCEKPVSQHLRGLSCDTDLQIPEGLLILYRYGNYSLDSSTLEKYICPKHRDNLGIYWRRQQRRCQSTFHPTNSHAKVERGIQVQVAKEIWMESGVYIPVGAGICNACRRKHLPRSEEGKKIIQRDIDQEIDSQDICSMDTEQSQSQSDKFSSIAGNTQNSSQDWYELQKTPREKLNAAMKILSESFEPITSQLTKKWEETSKSARSYYTKKARECIELVLSIMAPCQEDILLEKIQINSTQEIKLDNMTASVMEAFQNTSDSRTQTQILSIIVNNHTKTGLQTLIPGLTINKIDSARKHALVSGPGTILNQPKIYRMKLSKPKVSHFVEFILNPIYSNIVGFGETILKMSSKEKIKVPKVIRNVIDARLIETYLSYCKDNGFDTFSRASLYRILNVCHASKQKLLTKLETFGVTYPESKKLTNILHMVNTFMKFEYKTHLHKLDGCEDHCTVFALSDPGDAKFATTCEHSHETSCQKCSLVESCVPQIRIKLYDISANIPDQIVEELTYELDNSEKSLVDWKKHILRTIHQDQARTNVLKNLRADQGLVILDWAMKFLPYQFRETQSDFFGKKGISWHISCLVTQSENEEFDLQCYVHILENGSQGWFSVANIILHLLTNIKSTRPTLKEVFLKSDNAACYHCTNLLVFIQQNNGSFLSKWQNITSVRPNQARICVTVKLDLVACTFINMQMKVMMF